MFSIKDKCFGWSPRHVPKSGLSRVRGLFTALITPFDGRGKVDIGALEQLVRFQISKGAEGLYPCGSTGLGPMMKPDERKIVAETVVKTAGRKIPVVVQVGCADTATTIELAKHAEELGADAVASLTPFYYKPGDKAVRKHFESVSKAVKIPLFAYNIPQFTGNNLQPALVAELANEGVVGGIKDSSRDFLQLADMIEAVPEDFVVMNGTEEYGLYAIMSGADGLVSGGASALPELFISMVQAQRKGDIKSATSAQHSIQLVKGLVKSGPISAYYDILRHRGIDCGLPRPPFLSTDANEGRRIVSGLRELGLLDS